MAFFAFLGCDGSGKSAVIEQLAERLNAADFEVTCGHWRPMAFALEKPDSARSSADDPHSQKPRGSIGSVLKLGWLWLNWWIGWLKFLRRKNMSGAILFDRYHGDLLVDPRRYRYGGSMRLAKLASQLMPQPDLVFFLDASPDILLSRKQEVSRESLEKSRSAYLELTRTNPRFNVVDASQSLAEVVDQVENSIRRLLPKNNQN
jgi:thymidylate kinase